MTQTPQPAAERRATSTSEPADAERLDQVVQPECCTEDHAGVSCSDPTNPYMPV